MNQANPRDIRIEDYTYDLPADRIAPHPLPERDASRLLVFKNGQLSEDRYSHIADHIPAGALLVFNNTRVLNARLRFQKESGATIEVFCLEPHELDIATAMQRTGHIAMRCLVGGASKWKPGMLLTKTVLLQGEAVTLNAAITARLPEQFVITFTWSPAPIIFSEILEAAGDVPLPPYIKRKPDAADAERYQTIYALHNGSVAAPTAGLHFTDAVMQQLDAKKIDRDFVTLHVGAGTFKPVSAEQMGQHDMHRECITVRKACIENLLHHPDGCIVAVGTTSLRTLESLYWLGVYLLTNPAAVVANTPPVITQWDAYELPAEGITTPDALTAVLQWMDRQQLEQLTTYTQLLIVPGYRLRVAQALVTNFHQPQSTLLLLVAAIAGPAWRNLYDHALTNGFRFLSYGDGSLIFAAPGPCLSGRQA